MKKQIGTGMMVMLAGLVTACGTQTKAAAGHPRQSAAASCVTVTAKNYLRVSPELRRPLCMKH